MINNLSPEEIEKILSRNYIAHLACVDENSTPYLVPITFYYQAEENAFVCYTSEGKKIEILRKNPKVSVLVSEVEDLSHWRSVSIAGTFEELTGAEAFEGIKILSTRLTKLINDQSNQNVKFINDMARVNENNAKVIYRIHVHSKVGRCED
ncbi:MAG: pyridoxamine 5'-phosphate oxidase family protein [Bacteroidetes bacterium]|nr:pyridoxamine 5'-phosphate oxidase family protein [Bacteroidota bacterium]MCB0847341.1 pyridoxamine 5'-phosphate oxidase family protein [Bacteroidota bacterium]MCB0852365.1 pyridoxamine 5'-phosphate oxidase family protein [Bacteroidota bacterium]